MCWYIRPQIEEPLHRKYQFSNCDMNQLWSIISETVNYKFNVSHIMNN